MRISLVTLNFNGSEETVKLLKSLGNQTDQEFELIVVDNASEEADFSNLQEVIHRPTCKACPVPIPPLLAEGERRPSACLPAGRDTDWCGVVYPQVKLIRNSQNLGFSGGNNVGIRQALTNGSDWVVLLNNDTWVEKDFIERLKAVLEAKTGIVGIPLIEDGETAYCGKVKWLKPTLQHVYTRYKIQDTKYYSIGGAIAVHRNVFEKIGLLDEKYFLYFEDADFSVRARKAGIDISIAPDGCMIYHTVSTTTKKLGSPLLLRYHYRNALYFNLKNGPWYIKPLVLFWLSIIYLKQVIKILLGRNIKESKAIIIGLNDFLFNRMGQVKS